MKHKSIRTAVVMTLAVACTLVALTTPARSAPTGWQVSYDDKGGVTVKVGDVVVFSDADSLMLVNNNPWHGVYGWSNEAWATNFAHPNRVDSMKGDKKVVTFSDPAGQPVQITKQVTLIGPRELKILVKVATTAGSPGNLLSYGGLMPAALYEGATMTTDGIGYDLGELSPLVKAWPAAHGGGRGDDMRYNVTSATFGLKNLAGEPAKIVYTLTETPVSPGTPPNVRGWRVNAGIDESKVLSYQMSNWFQFDASAPFERDLELHIAWK